MRVKARIRASIACVEGGRVLVVRLRDPATGEEVLYPPGGAVEPGETPAEAAVREALEETGLRVTVAPEATLVARHPFIWNGVAYDVTTHWFRAALAEPLRDPPPVVDADYHRGALWVPIADALASMAVHPAIAEAARKVIEP